MKNHLDVTVSLWSAMIVVAGTLTGRVKRRRHERVPVIDDISLVPLRVVDGRSPFGMVS